MLVYKGERRVLSDGKHVIEPGDDANVIPFAMVGASGFKATVILEPKHRRDYVSGKTNVRYLFSCNIEYEKIEDFIKDWEVFNEHVGLAAAEGDDGQADARP